MPWPSCSFDAVVPPAESAWLLSRSVGGIVPNERKSPPYEWRHRAIEAVSTS
jgi:hypothetical protein